MQMCLRVTGWWGVLSGVGKRTQSLNTSQERETEGRRDAFMKEILCGLFCLNLKLL